MSTNPIKLFGPAEESSIAQLQRCLEVSGEDARGVLCADHHKGYSMPIGGVVASKDTIIPAGVGYDIACGNLAVHLHVHVEDIRKDIPFIMDRIFKEISFGMGRRNNEKVDHPVLSDIKIHSLKEVRNLYDLAAAQLGTVGGGNHYVDLFEDDLDGTLWIGVHFGSRGFGHKLATGFMALAAGQEWGSKVNDDMDAYPTTIPIQSELGQSYLAAMQQAGGYAYAGREWVVGKVISILGSPQILDTVHNHHNFAWFEMGPDGDHDWLVTRKGATPARPGQRGFIGGSMGENAVIVRGVESDESFNAFYSTIHGAGRVLSRRKAAGKTKYKEQWQCRNYRKCDYAADKGGHRKEKDGPSPKCPKCGHKLSLNGIETVVQPGLVDWDWWKQEMKRRGIELRGGGADEAPQCYKRLNDVLAHHSGTIEIQHTLRPIGVAMAGPDIRDPYKD